MEKDGLLPQLSRIFHDLLLPLFYVHIPPYASNRVSLIDNIAAVFKMAVANLFPIAPHNLVLEIIDRGKNRMQAHH